MPLGDSEQVELIGCGKRGKAASQAETHGGCITGCYPLCWSAVTWGRTPGLSAAENTTQMRGDVSKPTGTALNLLLFPKRGERPWVFVVPWALWPTCQALSREFSPTHLAPTPILRALAELGTTVLTGPKVIDSSTKT